MMSIYKILKSLLAPKPQQVPPTRKSRGIGWDSIEGKCIRHLMSHKKIDALAIQRIGTTDARKYISDLRRKGYLRPFHGARRAYSDVPNASGRGTHRVHYWSGKVPPEWANKSNPLGKKAA